MKQLLFNSILPSTGKSRSEHFILFTVAILGLVGSTYMLNNCLNKGASSYGNGNQQVATASLFPMTKIQEQIIEVKGQLKAEMPLEFSFTDHSVADNYMIDFGNGERRRCTSEAFTYAYSNPGNYKVQLHTLVGKRLHMVESRNVLISPKTQYH